MNYSYSIGAPWSVGILLDESRPPRLLVIFSVTVLLGVLFTLTRYSQDVDVGPGGRWLSFICLIGGVGTAWQSSFRSGDDRWLPILSNVSCVLCGLAIGTIIVRLAKYITAKSKLNFNKLVDIGFGILLAGVVPIFVCAENQAFIDMNPSASDLSIATLKEAPPGLNWRVVAVTKEAALLVSFDVALVRNYFKVVPSGEIQFVRPRERPVSRRELAR